MQRPEDDQRISRQKTGISAANFLPSKITYESLVKASEGCKGCELYKFATQTVFGEGVPDASLILVGEQPGNEEDIAGHPFVGPAGKLLDKALAEVGIPRDEVYVTNAVKHFKFEERGKRRLHKQPSARNIKACRPWLEAEIELIQPEAIICMGSTAAKSLLGSSFALTKHLGEWQIGPGNIKILATYHPSAALRALDHDQRETLYKAIVSDLKKAAKLL